MCQICLLNPLASPAEEMGEKKTQGHHNVPLKKKKTNKKTNTLPFSFLSLAPSPFLLAKR